MTFTFTDFDKAKSKAKSKKNCKKGMPCGAGCISKTKKCKQKMGAGGGAYVDHVSDPANLEKGAESSEEGKEPPLTDRFPPLNKKEPEPFEQKTKIDKNRVTTEIAGDSFQDSGVSKVSPPPYIQEVVITVNGTMDKGEKISEKDGFKLALASRAHVKEYVGSAKDGTVLSNSPYADDGFGAERSKLYQKAGFSAPDENNMMYSIVSGGKNIPITIDEIKSLKDSKHFTKK
jgi:hypothetical protein